MTSSTTLAADRIPHNPGVAASLLSTAQGASSAVSWARTSPARRGAAAALTLIFLILGTGLGLSAASP